MFKYLLHAIEKTFNSIIVTFILAYNCNQISSGPLFNKNAGSKSSSCKLIFVIVFKNNLNLWGEGSNDLWQHYLNAWQWRDVIYERPKKFPGHKIRPAYDFDYVALDLLTIYAEEGGVYTCHARNAYGEAETSASVKVSRKSFDFVFLPIPNSKVLVKHFST